MRILGIDPGFGRIGYGVIEWQRGGWVHVVHGCIETSPRKSFAERLLDIHRELLAIITAYAPQNAGIEKLFFAKNVTTGIDVSQARGVIVFTLAKAGIPVFECTPLEVKQALTGYGKAEKSQVQAMINIMLKLDKKRLQDDAADALAVALTVGNTHSLQRP